MLPVPRASLTSFSPDGNRIAYLPTSQDFRTWKRYRGGWKPPIGIYDLKKNTYEELPNTAGMDLFPMWHGDTIYYINDGDGVMNLYRYDLSTKNRASSQISRNMTSSGRAWARTPLSLKTVASFTHMISPRKNKLKSTSPSPAMTSNRARKSAALATRSAAHPFLPAVRALSSRLAATSLLFPPNTGARAISPCPGVHEQDPAWSPDGKWIAYLSDKSGEFEIYLRPQMGGDEVRVTSDGKVYRYGPSFRPTARNFCSGINRSASSTWISTRKNPSSGSR